MAKYLRGANAKARRSMAFKTQNSTEMRDRLNLFLLQSIMVKFENCPNKTTDGKHPAYRLTVIQNSENCS